MINVKRIIAIAGLVVSCSGSAKSQLCMTRTGFIGFYSKTSLENVVAESNQAYGVIDLGKKNLAFSVLLKGFIFRKELMQEHFNENYVESDKYPKASFTGVFTGDVPLSGNGSYKVTVKGNLNLHNITKAIETPATLEFNNGRLTGSAEFKLRPEDFNISIPSLVRDKIENTITVRVKFDCSNPK